MQRSMRRKVALTAGGVVAALALSQTTALSGPVGFDVTTVPTANPKAPGLTSPTVLSPELAQQVVAQGSMRLENPGSVVTHYGYDDGDGAPLVALPGDLPTASHKVEASKTEPDKNTYLVFPHSLAGASSDYDYGTHFLFQGHEAGTPGYLTRVNLDADAAHRVTLLATKDDSGANLPDFDGSTWDPWANRLLFTSEGSLGGGVWQSDLGVPATVHSLTGIIGQGGYEGIQNDDTGNLMIVEDAGGPSGSAAAGLAHAKQPNSFVFRFVPTNRADLTAGGVLQVLQVLDEQSNPITFHAGQADADIVSPDQVLLHTYGADLTAKWVTVHDTAVNGTGPFSANAAAKAAGGTPFKRPENGVFRPGSRFTEFFFTETGDTNALTEAPNVGGFGSLFKLTLPKGSDHGTISVFYKGDVAHTGLDNVTFASDHLLLAAEDGGDTLHTQRNALDSTYVFDTDTDYSTGAQPVRMMAEGRDPSATLDSGFQGMPGFQNDGDNEVTGIHVSDGDVSTGGILGAAKPKLFIDPAWRLFYTAQHGDNATYEILRRSR